MAGQPASGRSVPQGPAIWICGDCHSGNLGPLASAKGRITIQIRDLDQTVIGNPAHDLIRLALSLASAARGSDLPGVTTAKMMEQLIDGYEQSFAGDNGEAEDETEWPEVVQAVMKAALKRKWKDLAKERIEDTTPTIPLGKRFWPLTDEEREEIATAVCQGGGPPAGDLAPLARRRGSPLKCWMPLTGSRAAARWGYSAMRSCWPSAATKGELCLMDVKEAVPAVAPRSPKASMPPDHAERIVKGAWHLSPALGDRMIAARFQDRPVFLRELLPRT